MNTDKLILVVVFSFAVILVLAQPVRFFDGDEWTLFFATRHFSQFRFSITSRELDNQRTEARELSQQYGPSIGGLGLGSYRQRADGRYVVEKSPGYFIVLGLFSRCSLERYLNIVLLLALLLVLLSLGQSLFSPGHTRSILWLTSFTPAVLIMLYRPYMESFASYALVGLGGAAYIKATLLVEQCPERKNSFLFWSAVSGFCLGFALFVRQAIMPTILVFVLHAFYHYFVSRKKPGSGNVLAGLAVFLCCLALFAGVIMLYNAEVNGSALTFGYQLGKPKQSIYCFSFQHFFHGEPHRPFAIIIRNLVRMPELLFTAYPLLLFAIVGIPLAYSHLRRDVFYLLIAWIASIYALYLQFLVFNERHFMVIGRLYLPAVTPLAILAGYTLEKCGPAGRRFGLIGLISLGIISYFYFLCQINVDPFGAGILETFSLKNWISYE